MRQSVPFRHAAKPRANSNPVRGSMAKPTCVAVGPAAVVARKTASKACARTHARQRTRRTLAYISYGLNSPVLDARHETPTRKCYAARGARDRDRRVLEQRRIGLRSRGGHLGCVFFLERTLQNVVLSDVRAPSSCGKGALHKGRLLRSIRHLRTTSHESRSRETTACHTAQAHNHLSKGTCNSCKDLPLLPKGLWEHS